MLALSEAFQRGVGGLFQFNPFALRASEDFPVDVDRPT